MMQRQSGRLLACACLATLLHSTHNAVLGCVQNSECGVGFCLPSHNGTGNVCFCPEGFAGSPCIAQDVALNMLQRVADDLESSINAAWVLLSAFLVFFTQAGFGMLEAGSVRAKNTKNILLKNILDTAVVAMTFWAVGYGIAYGKKDTDGSNPAIGDDNFFMRSTNQYGHWVFSWAFASMIPTIFSGCIAERFKFKSYLISTFFISGFIYPMVVRWCWSESGWLSPYAEDRFRGTNGYLDFAGSGVVHLVGGLIGVLGAIMVGPRLGRFDDHRSYKIEGHSITMSSLGTLILWFGWYGISPGSTLALTQNRWQIAGRVAMNTTLSAASSALSTLTWKKFQSNTYDLASVLNGLLSGLVSVTAACAFVDSWAAVIIGVVGAVVFILSMNLLEKFQVDDPLGASAVHGSCGIWGVLSVGLFASEDCIRKFQGSAKSPTAYGLFMGGGFEQLGVQILGLLIITLWTVFTSAVLFFFLQKFVGLRVSREIEMEGLDRTEHGGHAYPEFDQTMAETNQSGF